jgi:hypothetical protein
LAVIVDVRVDYVHIFTDLHWLGVDIEPLGHTVDIIITCGSRGIDYDAGLGLFRCGVVL